MGPEECAIYDGEDLGRALVHRAPHRGKEAASKALGTGGRMVLVVLTLVLLTPAANVNARQVCALELLKAA